MTLRLVDPEDATTDPSQRATYAASWFEERVRFWQSRLRLNDWVIAIKVTPGLQGKEAETSTLVGHKAVITFREDQRIDDAENTVVHELLHVLWTPFEDLQGQLIRTIPAISAPIRAMVEAGLETPYEECLETLATVLVSLNGGEQIEAENVRQSSDLQRTDSQLPPGDVR